MKLITFPGDARIASNSPFCLKAMCLLEMAKVDWLDDDSKDQSAEEFNNAFDNNKAEG